MNHSDPSVAWEVFGEKARTLHSKRGTQRRELRTVQGDAELSGEKVESALSQAARAGRQPLRDSPSLASGPYD